MNTSNYFVIFLAIAILNCTGCTNPPKEIYNKDFNWTITIPENFDSVSAGQWAAMQNKGMDVMERTYGEKIDNSVKKIFAFKSDEFNYFEANYQPFDTLIEGDYAASCQLLNEMLYEIAVSQTPDTKIDTASYTVMIDNLEFQTYEMKMTFLNKKVLNELTFSRLFNNQEFRVNIVYLDDKKGALMLDSWEKSKFGKK